MAFHGVGGRAARALFALSVSVLFLAAPVRGETGPARLAAAEAAMLAGTRHEHGVKGVATYYAKRFNGRKTTSGTVYRPEGMTAAHPSLPIGTKVKVVNLANDQEVVVTVNDRCRKRKIPIIDLSRSAAEVLGFLGKGITRVRIVTLADASAPEDSAKLD